MSLTVKDLENLQAKYPDYRLELVKGKIIVMSPSGYESDEVAFRFKAKLWNWVEPRQLGRITGSIAGFSLANTRAPDVSFIRAERLPRSPSGYASFRSAARLASASLRAMVACVWVVVRLIPTKIYRLER